MHRFLTIATVSAIAGLVARAAVAQPPGSIGRQADITPPLAAPVSLKITDRSGTATIVTNPVVEYGTAIDVAHPGAATEKMRDGLRAFRGNAEVTVTWPLVDIITLEGVVAGRPSRINGTVRLKSGERTAVEFLIPAAGGMLRGKTTTGDYTIALKDIATISPVSVPSLSVDSHNPLPPQSGAGIGSGTSNAGRPEPGSQRPDGAYVPGKGVTLPRVIREVKPQYTADAMRAQIQGEVILECIALPDGTVGDVRIVKSLDPTFGLDQEAIRAAKQWRFQPGTRDGVAVPVVLTIELTFTLGKR
jgi:TonB family protein